MSPESPRTPVKKAHPAARARRGAAGMSVLLTVGLMTGMMSSEDSSEVETTSQSTDLAVEQPATHRLLLMLPDGRVVEVDPTPSAPSIGGSGAARTQTLPSTRTHGSR
jgi:hypothetical protein